MAVEIVNNSFIGKSVGVVNNFFSGIITNLIIAIIILLAGFIIGKLVGKFVQRFLHDVELDRIMKKISHIRLSLEEIIASTITYIIYFIAVVSALKQIGFATDILNIIAIAFMIIIVIGIFLSIKDFVPNAIAGILIHQKKFLNEGDTIKVKNIQGKIVKINLIETRIETRSKDIIYIPNSVLTKNEVIKVSKKKR